MNPVHVLLVVFMISLASGIGIAEDSCKTAKKEIGLKRQQLSEYVTAMMKMKNDAYLKNAFQYKIDEITKEIHQMESDLDTCTESGPEKVETAGGAKSEENQYATRSCGDLTRMLVQTIRKTNTLKRRTQSIFSDLSSKEKSELEQATQDLENIRATLKSRCSQTGGTGRPGHRPR